MKINRLIRKIEMNLGLNGILKGLTARDRLVEIIDLNTRDTFSRYFKHVIRVPNMFFNAENRMTYDKHTYKLPEQVIEYVERMGIEIYSTHEINLVEENTGLEYEDGLVRMGGSNTMGGTFLGMQQVRGAYARQQAEVLRSPIDMEYLGDYTMRFKQDYYDNSNNVFDLKLATQHPKNLSTIKDSYGEAFEKLATYDVQRVLWNNFIGFLNNLELGNARVELMKEDWGNAEQKRDDLVKEFEDTFITDRPKVIVV